MQQLGQEGTYKYLRVNEGDGIQHAKMKAKITKEYFRRIRMVTKSELNAINRMEAINTVATPVVTYSFNIVDWKMEEIRKLDRKTRKLLTIERMHTAAHRGHAAILKVAAFFYNLCCIFKSCCNF